MLLHLVKDCVSNRLIDKILMEDGWRIVSPLLDARHSSGDSDDDSIDYEEETQDFGLWFKVLILDWVTVNVGTRQLEWCTAPLTPTSLGSMRVRNHGCVSYKDDETYDINLEELFSSALTLMDRFEEADHSPSRSYDLHREVTKFLYEHILPPITISRDDQQAILDAISSQTNHIKTMDAEINAWNLTGASHKSSIQDLTAQITADMVEHPPLKALYPEALQHCIFQLQTQLKLLTQKPSGNSDSEIHLVKEIDSLTSSLKQLKKRHRKPGLQRWEKRNESLLGEKDPVYERYELLFQELDTVRARGSQLTKRKVRAMRIRESLQGVLIDLINSEESLGYDVQSTYSLQAYNSCLPPTHRSLGDQVSMMTLNVHCEAGLSHIQTYNWIIERCVETELCWKMDSSLIPSLDPLLQSNQADSMMTLDEGFIYISGPDIFTEINDRISTQCAIMVGMFFKELTKLERNSANTTKLILAYECILYRRIYKYLFKLIKLRYKAAVDRMVLSLPQLTWSDLDIEEPWLLDIISGKTMNKLTLSNSLIKRWLSSQENLTQKHDPEEGYINAASINQLRSSLSPQTNTNISLTPGKPKAPSFKRSSESTDPTLDLENRLSHVKLYRKRSPAPPTGHLEEIPRRSNSPDDVPYAATNSIPETAELSDLCVSMETNVDSLDISDITVAVRDRSPTTVSTNKPSDDIQMRPGSGMLRKARRSQLASRNGRYSWSSDSGFHNQNSTRKLETSALKETGEIFSLDSTTTEPVVSPAELDNPTTRRETVGFVARETSKVKTRRLIERPASLHLDGSLRRDVINRSETSQGAYDGDSVDLMKNPPNSKPGKVKRRSKSVGFRSRRHQLEGENHDGAPTAYPARHSVALVDPPNHLNPESPGSPISPRVRLTNNTKEQVQKIITYRRSQKSSFKKRAPPVTAPPATSSRPTSSHESRKSRLPSPDPPQDETRSEAMCRLFSDSIKALESLESVFSPLEKAQKLAKCLRSISNTTTELRSGHKGQSSTNSDDLVTMVILLLLSIEPELFRKVYLQLKFISTFMDEFMEGGVHNFSLVQFIGAVQYIQDTTLTKLHNQPAPFSVC